MCVVRKKSYPTALVDVGSVVGLARANLYARGIFALEFHPQLL